MIKKQTLIKTLLTCVMLYLTIWPVAAQTAKLPDYSGTWMLDTAASKFNGVSLASAATTELHFKQHEAYITQAKLAKGPDGAPFYFRDTLAFDGKPSVKPIPNTPNYTKTTTLKLPRDGSLVLSAIYKLKGADGAEQVYSSNEVYTLSANGNTLTLQRTSILPERTERITAVYHKTK